MGEANEYNNCSARRLSLFMCQQKSVGVPVLVGFSCSTTMPLNARRNASACVITEPTGERQWAAGFWALLLCLWNEGNQPSTLVVHGNIGHTDRGSIAITKQLE